MYYISKTLVNAEMRYLPWEKLVLALVHATRKLSQYFQAHTIFVLIEYPLQSLLKRSDFTGRIAKWGTQLGSFDIQYRPQNAVKAKSSPISLLNSLLKTTRRWFAMWRTDHGEFLWMVLQAPWGPVPGSPSSPRKE